MRIVFLVRLFYPHIGGVEKHVREIGKRLVEKGYDVSVITEISKETHSNGNQSEDSSAKLVGKVDGINIFRINTGIDNWFKKFRIWRELWKLRSTLKQADIIHCHDVFFWYLPFRFLFPNKRVYTTFHGYEGNNIPSRIAIFSHKIAEKFSNGNICIGDFLRKWYGTKPTLVSYGAVDLGKVNGSIRHNTDISKAIFVGRLEEETGIMEYLKAAEILKRKGIKINLTVLGDGSQMKKAINFAKKNKLEVLFKGFVSDVDRYLENTDIVFVSRYLGILEALGHKKLVFATFNNEIKKDYLEMASFKKYIYISPNGETLARDIEHAILNKDFSYKIEEGFRWVKKQSWEQLTDSYERLWQNSV